MKTNLISYLFLFLVVSCVSDFSSSRYRSKFHRHWHRKAIIIYRQDTYRNPLIRREAKLKLINPPSINLDKW